MPIRGRVSVTGESSIVAGSYQRVREKCLGHSLARRDGNPAAAPRSNREGDRYAAPAICIWPLLCPNIWLIFCLQTHLNFTSLTLASTGLGSAIRIRARGCWQPVYFGGTGMCKMPRHMCSTPLRTIDNHTVRACFPGRVGGGS